MAEIPTYGYDARGRGSQFAAGKGYFERLWRDQLAEDLRRLRSGELGMTAAEMEQAQTQAQQAAGRQVQALQANMLRQQMGAAQNIGATGETVQAAQQMGRQAAEAGAQAAASATEMSKEQHTREEEAIREAVSSEADWETKARWQAEQFMMENVPKLVSAILAGMGA